MGIRKRILFSFLTVFSLVLFVTALLSTHLIGSAVRDGLEERTRNTAALIDGEPRTLVSLEYLRRLSGAEGLSVDSRTAGTIRQNPPPESVFRARTRYGELVMTYGPDAVSREKDIAARPFAVVAIVGSLLALVLGYLIAQTIARPLERLSAQARALPAGDVKPVGGGAELDHLVDALNRMLAEVRHRERLAVMGRMAAGVAHEIRNPLSSIKMTVQMLREEAKDREPYDRVLDEIERLELTAAELTGASQPLRKERVALGEVAEEVLELMQRRLDHLAIRIEKHFAPAPEVEVDVARFKRCVMNLILNGAQAMPAGGPLAVEIAPRNGAVRFAVTDAGGGIPAAVRDRVFEPFVTTKQDGVGLGLALTRRIVEEHGGKIGFEEAKGGTTFWIEIPHG